ncbi:hypothetical protein [Streptomyces sp. NPDC002172]
MTATRLPGHLETLRPYDLVVTPVITALGLTACAGALYTADYLTRHEDGRTKPYRPIPCGRLRAATARRCAVLLRPVAFVLATLANWRSLSRGFSRR